MWKDGNMERCSIPEWAVLMAGEFIVSTVLTVRNRIKLPFSRGLTVRPPSITVRPGGQPIAPYLSAQLAQSMATLLRQKT
jgi:hypothetical protein